MTTAGFRKLALSFPDASEAAHMRHPDFRVRGRIFATLGYPSDDYGVLMLSPQEQGRLVSANPRAFSAVKGAWGRSGNTQVRLENVDLATLREAMILARRNAIAKPGRPSRKSKR
jgi:hypothetical protein